MKIDLRSARRPVAELPGRLRVVGVVSGALTEAGRALDEANDGVLSKALKGSRFRGEEGATLLLWHNDAYLMLLGLGGRRGVDADRVRAAGTKVAAEALRLGVREVALENFWAEKLGREAASYALAEGLYLGSYRFSKYRSDAKPVRVRYWISRGRGRAVAEAGALSEATLYARDLVNEPPNALTPERLAEEARTLAEAQGLEVEVLGPDQIEALGMGAFLAVARGSANPPRLIHLVYRPEKARRRVALVGKGLCFDTGGYSLKPTEGMRHMKADMAGAAAVLGTFRALAALEVPVEVHGVIAAAENKISGGAYVVDEVVRAMNGKTIEVGNTDAEGRLTLADALAYASRQAPDAVVSIATLTGSSVVALGRKIAALFATDGRLAEALRRAAAAEGEKIWPMPLEPSYKKLLKSEVADLANVGNREGGAIQAALFLSEFVKEPYAHLDIAGPAFIPEAWELGPAGGTGFGVRTLARWLAG